MGRFQEQVDETAAALGVGRNEALVLELLSLIAFDEAFKGNNKRQAFLHVAAKHAIGEVSKESKDAVFSMMWKE